MSEKISASALELDINNKMVEIVIELNRFNDFILVELGFRN